MSNLRIAELDFDTIKQNLKTYLQSQSEFTDYDFEGSGLAVLLDILAYNTHYNAYLANMLVNEMFLDSAVKRSSAVSIAKHLNYTPRSVRGSRAIIDITVNNPSGSPTSLTLPRFTSFSSSINGSNYNFLNIEPVVIEPSSGIYFFNNVEVVQGVPLSYAYTVSTVGPSAKYEIPNVGVDTSTLKVSVQTSSSNVSTEVYTLATDLTSLSNTSPVYFLEETPFGTYNIFFGDNVFSKQLTAGNIVNIEYLVSEGESTNVSSFATQSFSSDTNIGSSTSVVVATVSNASGGASRETIESIKFNAPRYNRTNNRAVTIEDFKTIILSNVTQVEAVNAWGGEDNIPPSYGKVYISLKPYAGTTLSPTLKDYIINDLLKPRQIATITTEIVDPDYTYIKLNVAIIFDKNLTSKTSTTLYNNARTVITNYFSNNLQKFNKNFYHSQLIELINNIDPAIVSTFIGVNVQKRFTPILNTNNSFLSASSFKFFNPILPGSINSTRFYINNNNVVTLSYLKDTPNTMPPDSAGAGSINLYNSNTDELISTLGTINYNTGEIGINNLLPVALPSGQFDIRITGRLQNDGFDVQTTNNQILVLDDSSENLPAGRFSGLTVTVNAL